MAEVLNDPEVDAVDIALPHHLHPSAAIAALRAGKHVSLQKAPAFTLADLEATAVGGTSQLTNVLCVRELHVLPALP